MGDLEAEAAVRQAENLVARGTRVATCVGDDDHLELEPLGRVDGQQADDVGVFFLRDRFQLTRADRVLLADETDEAFDVTAAQLLVRAREPRELAHVRVTAPSVGLREDGEVVVVLEHDLLA